MAANLNLVANLTVKGTYTGTAVLGSAQQTLDENFSRLSKQFQLGTGATDGNADQFFQDIRTLTASASETLDLSGTLTDIYGATISLVRAKLLAFFADAGNTNDVIIGNTSANAFTGPLGASTHTITLKPGQGFIATNTGAGWTVTAGTGDLIKVANSAGTTSVKYTVMVIGASA